MTKKYEFVPGDEIAIGGGRTVQRIRYLIDIPRHFIKAGDLGGYIELERNLSHDGDCAVRDQAIVSWLAMVFDNALVAQNAKVSGSALVSDNARVVGDAIVDNDAQIMHNAHLYGFSCIRDNAEISGNIHVYGNAVVCAQTKLSGNAKVSGDVTMTDSLDYLVIGPTKPSKVFWYESVGGLYITAHKDDKIGVRVTCGYISGTIAEFTNALELAYVDDKIALQQSRLICQLIADKFGISMV